MARSHSELARNGNVTITRVTKQVNSPSIHHSNSNSSSSNHNTKEANLHLNSSIKTKTSMYKKVNTNKNQKLQKETIIDPGICMKCGDTQHRPGFTCPVSRYQCKKCKKFGHFTKSCLSTMANVNELNLDLTGKAAHRQKINALNASKETFHICNVKVPKAKSAYTQTSKSVAQTITS